MNRISNKPYILADERKRFKKWGTVECAKQCVVLTECRAENEIPRPKRDALGGGEEEPKGMEKEPEEEETRKEEEKLGQARDAPALNEAPVLNDQHFRPRPEFDELPPPYQRRQYPFRPEPYPYQVTSRPRDRPLIDGRYTGE